ncbi:MAG: hypothetical protein R3Y63_15920 [Eubacteriales bacterium]
MATYSKEKKAEILKLLEPPTGLSIAEVSKKENISQKTIKVWMDKSKEEESMKNSKKKWNSEEKFHIVMETYSLNEVELAEYARKKGIFLSDIKEWKENCCTANGSKSSKEKSLVDIKKNEKSLKEELKSCKKELNSTKKQLSRKDETIAEVTALLVLKGKAQAIWGESEDE